MENKVKKNWSKRYIRSNSKSRSSLKLFLGKGAFAKCNIPWGFRVSKIQGIKTCKEPNINNIIELSYIVGPYQDTIPYYIDQRLTDTPDAFIHASEKKGDKSVNISFSMRCGAYYAIKNIKKGSELIYQGNIVQIYAMILNQSNIITPVGIMNTDNLEIKLSNLSNSGNGLFMKNKTPAGRLIGSYSGEIKSVNCEPGPYQFHVRGPKNCKKNQGFVIDAQSPSKSSILRYINHNYEKEKINVIFEHMGTFGIAAFTTRTINTGEELYADYGKYASIIIHKKQ